MPTSREETSWKQITLFLLTFGIIVVCAFILQPFFMAIVGAIVLAVITQRPYNWLDRRIRNKSLAATLALILVILAIVVPSFFLVQSLGKQVFATVKVLRDDNTQTKFSEFLGSHPS